MLRAPDAIEEHGPYDIVIGETEEDEFVIHLFQFGDEFLVASADSIVSRKNYRGDDVFIGSVIDKIVNEKNDWNHNQLGNTEEEVAQTLEELLAQPDEVYEGINPSNGDFVEIYVKEMILNGIEVIVFAIVVNGEVITSYVPTSGQGAAPPDSDYEEVYDRDSAIQTIQEQVLEPYLKKVLEDREIIEDIDVGDSPTDP